MNKLFDPKKLNKLNNPERLKDLPPEYIWNKLNLDNPECIIDIGAGTGFYSVPFLNLMGKGIVYSCDISEIMINWLKENICKDYSGIVPLLIKNASVPLENSIADLVIMINLHHELDEPVILLKEAMRLLKTGGKICIIDWKREDMPFGPPMEIRVESKEVQKQLNEAGFRGIDSDNSLAKQFVVMGVKASLE